MAQMKTASNLLRPEEAAERLGVSKRTIQTWLWKGKIKGVKLTPKCWRIREEDIEKFISGSTNVTGKG